MSPPSYEMARRSFDLLKKLEGWGVYFPQDEKGNYRTLQYHPIGNFLTAMEEPDLKVIISNQGSGERGAGWSTAPWDSSCSWMTAALPELWG